MLANQIISDLKNAASEKRRKTNEWFFKTGKGQYSEHDKFIGVATGDIRKIAKKFYKSISLRELTKLIKNPKHEIRHCALIILVYKYQSGDEKQVFDYYLKNIKAANNWDLVDTSCHHIMGDYIYHNQNKIDLLFNLSTSNELWEKRIAIISTLAFIKQHQFEPTLIISKTLINDKHDLIHKAVGWMLREVFKKDENTSKLFIRQNYRKLPRTTLRYAIERMQKKQRLLYLKGKFNVSN